ncbi:putative DsbA family dithiol-disulfide isomerase [Kribbella voronezhensis]|uniref:Putative DsbA family dithiol-disulfide isomerase n=1 Tax=Kribbella voronezhensis TaxID=2512212 RepID=A0A4R7THM7_9ACTN|nr:DsbA family oxidoreductase [Kribbella voronezhensis]TDU91795.1 putative DsbA family dithiol-disulfide isomerase [Kribbella voronezhensis]
MRIDVWSDVVCPWCYIGKRRLEEALAKSGEQAEVVWHSFQLDPSATNDDERDLATRLGEKFGGGREFGLQANERVTTIAAEVGLEFHLDVAKAANTVDAHRVLHLARELAEAGEVAADTQGRLKERFLRGYFTEGLPMGDHATLTRLAVEVGLPEVQVSEVLAGSQYADDVAADQAQALAYGANGVPFFVIDQKYGVSGAQPVEVFAEALRRAAADRQPVTLITAPGGSDADACGPDGCPI